MPERQLLIQEPSLNTDSNQDKALAACTAKKAEIVAFMKQYNVVGASIATYASGANDDDLPYISCTIKFATDAPQNGVARDAIADHIEALTGFRVMGELSEDKGHNPGEGYVR